MRPANVFVAGGTDDDIVHGIAREFGVLAQADIIDRQPPGSILETTQGNIVVTRSVPGLMPEFDRYPINLVIDAGDNDGNERLMRAVVGAATALGLSAVAVFDYELDYTVARTPDVAAE